MLKQAPLLLDRCEFSVTLIDNQVQQSVANPLIGDFKQAPLLWPAFECAELNLIRGRWPELGFELIIFNLGEIHPDVVASDTEQVNPIVKCADACCGHLPVSSFGSLCYFYPSRIY